MPLIGTSTIVFPKLDKENSAAKRKHVCSVCSRAFKRSEHCIRHQRGRKLPPLMRSSSSDLTETGLLTNSGRHSREAVWLSSLSKEIQPKVYPCETLQRN